MTEVECTLTCDDCNEHARTFVTEDERTVCLHCYEEER